MLLFGGSAVYFLYNFLQEADGTDCSNGELETFLATGYPVSRGWAVQSSLGVLNQAHESLEGQQKRGARCYG